MYTTAFVGNNIDDKPKSSQDSEQKQKNHSHGIYEYGGWAAPAIVLIVVSQ